MIKDKNEDVYYFQSELNEIKLKLKSGSGDSKASAAFFDAIFEDPEAKVTQTEISETRVKFIIFQELSGAVKNNQLLYCKISF